LIYESYYPLGMHLKRCYPCRNQVAPGFSAEDPEDLPASRGGILPRAVLRTDRLFLTLHLTMKRYSLLFTLWIAAIPAVAVALDVRAYIEEADKLIVLGQLGLARAYLEPALIAPELHESERSRAYYIRGYSFADERLYVSARLDYNRALEFNPDNPGALVALGDLQRSGLGIEPNPEYALKLYEKSAKLGYTLGKVATGRAYLLGEGATRDVQVARRWLAEAASSGDANAMMHLGASFRLQDSPDADPQEAKAWYLKAAESGAAEAWLAVGFMHANGELGDRNLREALTWYRRAADLGLAAGQTLVGHAYLQGQGVSRNVAAATDWFEKAAAQGDSDAQVAVGFLFEAGEGKPADLEMALKWYRRAALAGNPEGMSRYASLMGGRSDPLSQREAVIWFRKLAAKNKDRANSAAWLLATSTHPDIRDGQEAVRLALVASDGNQKAAVMDTLAAAWAEAGDFNKAVEIQKQALALPDGQDPRHRPKMEQRLESYEKGRPWRE